ncbi:hypothetical protein [Rhizobium leguminosarum]|uniref:hypothetical protein n=1 Tax=Rhizobium leguminosarum TaxID=384 RepID=UPI001FD92EE7|nr:hypothetical protein [Rhizobium leguminosarum]
MRHPRQIHKLLDAPPCEQPSHVLDFGSEVRFRRMSRPVNAYVAKKRQPDVDGLRLIAECDIERRQQADDRGAVDARRRAGEEVHQIGLRHFMRAGQELAFGLLKLQSEHQVVAPFPMAAVEKAQTSREISECRRVCRRGLRASACMKKQLGDLFSLGVRGDQTEPSSDLVDDLEDAVLKIARLHLSDESSADPKVDRRPFLFWNEEIDRFLYAIVSESVAAVHMQQEPRLHRLPEDRGDLLPGSPGHDTHRRRRCAAAKTCQKFDRLQCHSREP